MTVKNGSAVQIFLLRQDCRVYLVTSLIIYIFILSIKNPIINFKLLLPIEILVKPSRDYAGFLFKVGHHLCLDNKNYKLRNMLFKDIL